MTTVTVANQEQLEAALADTDVDYVIINNPAGVWLTVRASGSSTVEAYGSSTVEAYDSSTVEAYDSSTVRASGSSTVEAYDSSTVEAYDSSTVRAYDSSTVRAYDSSTVEASDSSTVEASDSSTVRAYDSSTVRAGSHTAVHLHSGGCQISGGVLIDHTDIDLKAPEMWAAYRGIEIRSGDAIVYKAVDIDMDAGQHHNLTNYPIGGAVEAPDWDPTARRGGGLHFGVSPSHARRYYNGDGVPRYLECAIPVDAMVVLDDKVKSARCTVLREVDEFARPVDVNAALAGQP
jgi:hypothetical protein